MDRGGALTGWHVSKRLLRAVPLQAAFPFFFLLGSAACRRAEDPAYARRSTVVMAVPGIEVMKPDAWDLDFLTFLPLATRDERGELEGRLARSWEHSADFKEWTYHLRTDVRWDDGVLVTAHDVKFTLDLLGHPEVAEYPGFETTVVNDSTVRIRAAKPGYIDDIVYYPKHLLEDLDPKRFWEWDFWTHPVGNGPFRFVRYVPETMIEFEANPGYYRGKPRIERVILKFVGFEANFTELLAGNVDIAMADVGQIPRMAKDPRFRLYHRANSGSVPIYWKLDHPLFRDPRVRRALTLAMDRRKFLQILNLPAELTITDGVFTERQLRGGEFPEPLPFDREQARALLKAAGWADRDGDGVREKDGRPFRFTASVRSLPVERQLAVLVQDHLRRVGIRMDIAVLDWALLWEQLRSGDFEAWMNWQQPGASSLRRDFGRGNTIGYENPQAFAIIDSLQATADPEELDALYRRLTQIFRADMPFTRLIPSFSIWFVDHRVRGLSQPFRADPAPYMAELWLEERDDR